MSKYEYEYERKSLFWPVFLIGLGIVFLLQNMGMIEEINLRLLLRLWPLLIVAAGLNLLFQRVRWFGGLMGAGLAVVAVAFLVYAPELGLSEVSRGELTTEFYSEAVDGAETLEVNLDLDYGQITIMPLVDSNDLMTLEVTHRDDFTWSVQGSSDRRITANLDVIQFFNPDAWLTVDEVIAEVLIAPDVPLIVEIDQGSGTVNADLSDFELISFEADTGAGTMVVDLPAGEYPVDISSGAGTLDLDIAPETVLDLTADIGAGRIAIDLGKGVSGQMHFDIGSGSVELSIPEGVGVQVHGDTGVGHIGVPSGYVRVNGSNNSGVWESPNYNEAAVQLVIFVDLGAGQVVIRD